LPVNIAVAVPVVAFKNAGYRLVAVVVSFVIAEPPTLDHAVPLYPSNSVLVVLNRKNPADGLASLCPVVPVGRISEPVEAVITSKLTLAAAAVTALVPPLAIGRVPVTPVVSGSPVRLVAIPLEGVPNAGVVSEGLMDITTLPVPVIVLLTRPLEASVNTGSAAVRLDTIGCAVKVATPVTPRVPETFRLVNELPLTNWKRVPS
jgi:hypothetical protein